MVAASSPLTIGQTNDESQLLSSYYDVIYGPDERLVTGPFYYGAARGSIIGHPYYIDEDWKTGAVEIDDLRFEGLLLKYDISINQVILKFENSDKAVYQLGLRTGNITKVEIGLRAFVPLLTSKDSTEVFFAELMVNGDIKYLIERHKTLALTKGGAQAGYIYNENLSQYIHYNGQLIKFKGKRTLLKIFPELKPQIKQFIRQNGMPLSAKQLTERAKLVQYCNNLIMIENE